MAWTRPPGETRARFSTISHSRSIPSPVSCLKLLVGAHFLTNLIHFSVGALMACWWCEHVRPRGPLEIIWNSSVVGHGKSHWSSSHIFLAFEPRRPISESGVSQDPMARLSGCIQDGNFSAAHRQGTPQYFPCLKLLVGAHFLTSLIHFNMSFTHTPPSREGKFNYRAVIV